MIESVSQSAVTCIIIVTQMMNIFLLQKAALRTTFKKKGSCKDRLQNYHILTPPKWMYFNHLYFTKKIETFVKTTIVTLNLKIFLYSKS